jgi:16S rRNA (guanine966-N2)-methyltransferase
MRVVAGRARGLRLLAPPGRETRPTSDRVREAIGNALESLQAFDGSTVIDLYAGSGALGIEALSRGASTCVFVDQSRTACEVIRQNIDSTACEAHAQVQCGDAIAFATQSSNMSIDVVFADPPYRFSEWDALLATLHHARIVVAESDREVPPPQGWETIRARRYGSTWVTFLAPVSLQ